MVDQARSEAVGLASAALAAAAAAASCVADPDDFTPVEAVGLVRAFDRIERKAAAAKLLLARKVAGSTVWQDEGHSSAAGYWAALTGSSVSVAQSTIAASKALPGLPATREAVLAGVVSSVQAQLVADGAKANPAAEASLLAKAPRLSHKELRDEVLRAKATGDPDPDATQERIHKERRCGNGTDAEGAWTLHAKATAVAGSVVNAELDVLTDQIFREHRSADAVEGRGQYRMDALARMAENSKAYRLGLAGTGKRKQAPPTHLALLRADISALQRGHVIGDELCEIAGIGPISVRQARAILGDAVLRLVLTDGIDVRNVTTLAHRPTMAMHYAMLWSNPACVAEGCGNTILQFDHRTGTEYADTRHTRLAELDHLCTFHHMLHTRHR
ncbi:MAG: 13E12 repeat family protein, partial [Actinomycetota bacterium]|nr:13E12 repeat family protein [Actinomycetota bacterium]